MAEGVATLRIVERPYLILAGAAKIMIVPRTADVTAVVRPSGNLKPCPKNLCFFSYIDSRVDSIAPVP